MDAWPGTLQGRLNSTGFELVLGDTLIRSQNDMGPAKVRSRSTDGIDQYSCEIFIDHALLPDLTGFYKTTLRNGSLKFLFNDPFTETATEYRFVRPPTIRPLGGRTYQVQMLWEKMSLGSEDALVTEGVWPMTTRPFDYTDISDPTTETTVVVRTLPFNRVLHQLIAVLMTPFAGPGLTSLKLDIGIAGEETKFINGFDLMGAVGLQDSIHTTYFPGTDTNIIATITAVGCNLEDLTAGEFTTHIGEAEVGS